MLAAHVADGAALAAHDDRVRGGTIRGVAHALHQLAVRDPRCTEEDVLAGHQIGRREDPIEVGDMVRRGQKIFTIPNSNVMGGNITNYSMKPTRRIDMVVGIGYDADIRKAKAVLENIMASEERVLKDPAVTIGVAELGDSSVNSKFNHSVGIAVGIGIS